MYLYCEYDLQGIYIHFFALYLLHSFKGTLKNRNIYSRILFLKKVQDE